MEQDVFQMRDRGMIVEQKVVAVKGKTEHRPVIIGRRRRPEKSLPVQTGHVDEASDHLLVIGGETFGENGGIKDAKDKKGKQQKGEVSAHGIKI